MFGGIQYTQFPDFHLYLTGKNQIVSWPKINVWYSELFIENLIHYVFEHKNVSIYQKKH